MSDEEDDRDYKVVVNHEEQYSIWPSYRDIPNGWREAGFAGKRKECLEWIANVWTDMRPLSLRRSRDQTGR
jgi:MbtH protein